MKKATVIGVIFLFIGISIAPSISGSIGELSSASLIEEVSDISFKLKKTNENYIASYDEPAVFDTGNSFGKTIYVDGDNTEGPWYGTENYPYQHIQDGVDAAGNGDTVFVYSGIYYEHIVINTSISLIGEYREIPIIDGNNTGNILVINADNTTVRDFIMQNCSDKNTNFGNIIVVNSDNNTIFGNYFYPNIDVAWYHSKVIKIIDSDFNNIYDNYIEGSHYGIDIDGSSNSNKIWNNKIFSDSGCGIGIDWSSENNIISDNEIIDEGKSSYGIAISGSNNYVSSNVVSGFHDGIDFTSYNNTIVNNSISFCRYVGIWNTDIYGFERGANGTIIGNIIDNCFFAGLFIEGDNNCIKRNTCLNSNFGFIISLSLENEIIENNFINNNISGLLAIPIANEVWLNVSGSPFVGPNFLFPFLD
jgi:hypothetical protein